MALDQKTLGRRLREARENRRLTQEQAAQGIGISRTALVQIEAGNRSLSTLELANLAKLYHRSAADFFEEDESRANAEDDPLLIIHRLQPELISNSEVNHQVSRCLKLCSIGADLEKTLGILDPIHLPSYDLRAPTRPFEATRQGEQIADAERRRLGLGYGPIADMADLITTQGVWASGVRGLPDEMSGIFFRHNSIGFVILVNYGHLRTRKRFSYAHEYGHALLDRKSLSASVTSKGNSQEFIERRANAFAAAFLMPREGVRWFLELLEKGGPSRRYRVTFTSADIPVDAEERPSPGSQEITFQDVVALAYHFDVSYPAAVYRLSDLQFVNADEKANLLNKSDVASRLLRSKHAFDESEDREVSRSKRAQKPDRELISQIVWLAVEAYRREAVSQEWLRELSGELDISAEHLIELAEAAS